jgi:aryl-phospho-beta-D-glucosidase BglC (GH1 family)
VKARTILATLICFFTGLALYAADPNLGTWKLNESKSKLPASGAKNTLVVYTAVGDNVKVSVDGVDGSGKTFHSEWTGKFDGKDYPVTGDAASDTRSYTKVDANTLTFVGKKAGKTVFSGKVAVAADGKSRTVTAEGNDASGKSIASTAVYDKQ